MMLVRCVRNRRSLAPGLVALGALLLFAPAIWNGCGAALIGQRDSSEGSSVDEPGDHTPLTIATTVSTALATFPATLPPELSQFRGLGERLQVQGVPVIELRGIPAEDYGSGIEVVLASTGTPAQATADDAISTHLVFRAAVLEKMAGSEIEAVAVAFLKGGEVTSYSAMPVDQTIDRSWYETPGLPLEETTFRAREYVLGSLAHFLYEAEEFRVTEDPDGTRVLSARLVLNKTGLSQELIEEPFVLFGETTQTLNRRTPTKIGLVRLEISDAAGEPVLCSIGDLQLESATWWEAGKIARGAYPRPDPSLPGADSILADEMPSDFGFVAAYGPGGSNVIDTFAGTFTKDIISPPKPNPNPTTELRLTPEELTTLYQDLVEMNILDYPSVFRPELGEQSFAWMSPHDDYLLSIRTSGIDKDVVWEAGYCGAKPEAVSLREWFAKLQRIIEAKPEYRALPPAEGGYA